jgi:hypothetical protein
MDDMKTRYRELYLSFLRLDKVKKMTTTRNNDRISSEQKKEIQHEARTLQEDTFSERGTDDLDLDAFDVRPRQEHKSNRHQVQ